MKELLDEVAMRRALTRISHEILEANKGANDLVLVGIKTRGEPIAQQLANKIKSIEGVKVPVEVVDITFYRDDLGKRFNSPVRGEATFNTNIENKTVVLVDDVIFTGRTARAAMDAIMDYGRPRYIQLATLVDRGHRELPIRPDFVGKNIPTSKNENVKVMIKEIDNEDKVIIKKTSQEDI